MLLHRSSTESSFFANNQII